MKENLISIDPEALHSSRIILAIYSTEQSFTNTYIVGRSSRDVQRKESLFPVFIIVFLHHVGGRNLAGCAST